MQLTSRQISCRGKFEAKGMPRSGASALVGNFSRESGPNLPTAFRKTNLDHGSQGLAQWRLGRLDSYMRYVHGLHPTLATNEDLWPWYGRMDHQVDFVLIELKANYADLYKRLMDPDADASTLAADVCWQYERPSKALSGIADRIAWAKALAAAPTPAKAAQPTAAPSVSDVMHAQAADHATKAQGGLVTAALGAVGLGGGVVMNAWPDLPWWEWGVLACFAVLVVVGIAGAFSHRASANSITSAAVGVQNFSLPATAVNEAKPVPLPAPAPSPNAAVKVDTTSPEFAAAVDAEIRRMGLSPLPSVMTAMGQSPGSASLPDGPSLSIGKGNA